MTDAAIATDIHETLDVELDLRTEVALNLIFCLDHLTNGCCLIVCPVLYLDVAVYTRLLEDGVGCAATMP